MPASIYIYSKATSPALKEGRGGLEDDLDTFLADAGEVTGSGSGAAGWNVDVDLGAGEDLDIWKKKIVCFLREWGVPSDVELEILPEGWRPGVPKTRVKLADEP